MKGINWVCTSGEVQEKKGILSYSAHQTDSTNPALGFVHGVIKSNSYFSAGKISFSLKLDGDKSHFQLVLGAGVNPVYIGINEGLYAYSIKAYDQVKNQYLPVMELGMKNTLPIGEWINIEVEVVGSMVVLRVSEVEVIKAIVNVYRAPITFAFWGSDTAHVKSFSTQLVEPKVFVVMQFTDEFNELFRDVILPVCDDFDLEVIRADDIYNNGLIIQDIINSINESAIIIADITPDNPNVYYEVGFAHASKKPVVLLCDSKRDKLPFDLSGFRTIFYRNTIAGKSEVEGQLRKHLEALMPHNKSLK